MTTDLDQARIILSNESIWILHLALAMIMFGVALDLKTSDFTRLLKQPRPILAGLASQFVLLPVFTLILVHLVDPLPSIALGMFVVASCPGGVVSNFFTNLSQGNTALSVSLTVFATSLAILMTPININLLGSAYQPTFELLKKVSVSIPEIIHTVAMILGLPIVFGMYFNHRWPWKTAKLRKYFKAGSILFFAGLVLFLIYQNLAVLKDYAIYIVGIVILHNFLALCGGFIWGKLLSLPVTDVRSITIETGIQNGGLALILILTFFEGLGGTALIAAFWGIWHLISGLILSGLWSRLPIRKRGGL